jgi:mRNA interferase RelE/StbE
MPDGTERPTHYRVEISPRAQRDLKRLPRDVLVRLRSRIDSLAAAPRPHGVEKLTDQEDIYRVREGDYRILYRMKGDELLVLVVRVGDRKDIYRRLT